ncbi:MAG TPA: hypothetical protein VI296_02980, partial [Candidatus Dormibacteraeota bacterium]
MATVIDRARYTTGIPHPVLLLGDGAELGQDAVARTRFGRDSVVGLETVSIGVEVDERREVLRVLGFTGHVGSSIDAGLSSKGGDRRRR